jgi:hypothetical protein
MRAGSERQLQHDSDDGSAQKSFAIDQDNLETLNRSWKLCYIRIVAVSRPYNHPLTIRALRVRSDFSKAISMPLFPPKP